MLYFYEDKGEGWAYNVGVEVDDDKISVSEWDLSQTAEDFYGDSDVEFFLLVKKQHAEKFLRACCEQQGLKKEKIGKAPTDQTILNTLEKLYKGKKSAFMDIKNVLKTNEIPFEFQRW